MTDSSIERSNHSPTDSSGPATVRQSPPLAWLIAGALAGLLVAAYGLLQQAGGSAALRDDEVARINEAVVDRARLERSIATAESNIDRELTADERSQVLGQMIDEELLVQRGLEMNMVATEPSVRSAIVQSLIASVTAEADAANPDDAELERYLAEHAADYTYATALDVDAWVTDDERLAQAFIADIRAGQAPPVREDLRPVPGLPADPLPLQRLRMFVGPAIAAAAVNMPAGSSAVYARQGRWYVVRVNSHEEAVRASLDAVRSQVLLDYRRGMADRLLAEYIEGLRRTADIQVAAPP